MKSFLPTLPCLTTSLRPQLSAGLISQKDLPPLRALLKRRCHPLIATRNSESMLDLELIQQHQCVEFGSSRRALEDGKSVYS
jgi:hypothetical protein